MLILMTFLIGVVAGLRTMTAPAAVAWGAVLGWLPVGDSWAAFMGHRLTLWLFSALAVVEYVGDQLPSTPSRKVPAQFGARILSGAFCGAVIGAAVDSTFVGLAAGAAGAVAGTLGGAEARSRLASALGSDRRAGLLEDAVAIGLAFFTLGAVS